MKDNKAILIQMNQSQAPYYSFFQFYRYSEDFPDIKPHWHKELEIMFSVKGEHSLLIDGESYTIKERDIVIIPPNVYHSSIKKIEGRLVCLSISSDFMLENGIKNLKGKFQIQLKDELLWENFKFFYTTYYSNDFLREINLRSILLDILIVIYSKYFNASIILDTDDHFNQLIDYLNANYTERITLSNLAEKFHYNKSYLAKKFKKETGRTIIDYVNCNRCIYAESLLKTTQLKNKEIAELSGFGSVSHFLQTYKKLRGRTPGKTREMHKHYSDFLGIPVTLDP